MDELDFRRTQDPEGTRLNIIEIASEEFALNGLSGARIDDEQTKASRGQLAEIWSPDPGLLEQLAGMIVREIVPRLPATLLFDHPTPSALARHLCALCSGPREDYVGLYGDGELKASARDPRRIPLRAERTELGRTTTRTGAPVGLPPQASPAAVSIRTRRSSSTSHGGATTSARPSSR